MNNQPMHKKPMLDKIQAFETVCAMLQAGHRKDNNHSPSDTLNRLFYKNLSGKPDIADNPPVLSPENISISLEKWPKPKLRELAPRKKSRAPARLDLPVVIIKYRGVDCLIDGGSRCHHWHLNDETDEHDAWVLTVKEPPVV